LPFNSKFKIPWLCPHPFRAFWTLFSRFPFSPLVKLSQFWKTFTFERNYLWTFLVIYRTLTTKPLKTDGFQHVKNVQKKSNKVLTPPFTSAKLTPHTEQKTENTDKK